MKNYYEELLKNNKSVINLICKEIKSSWNNNTSKHIGFIHDMFSLKIKGRYHKKEDLPEGLFNDFLGDITESLINKKLSFDKIILYPCLPYFVDVKILNLVSENNLIFDLKFFIHIEYNKAYNFNSVNCGEISFYDKKAEIPIKYIFSSNSFDILIPPSGHLVMNDNFISVSFEEFYSYASEKNEKNAKISLKKIDEKNDLINSGLYTPDCLEVSEPFKSDCISFFNLFENIKDINYNELKEIIINPELKISQETKDLLLLKNDIQLSDTDSSLISMFSPPEASHIDIKLKGNVFDKMSRLRHGVHFKKYYS